MTTNKAMFLAITALVASAVVVPASAQPIPVRSGAAANIAFGPMFVLADTRLGIAAKHGLDFNVKVFSSGPPILDAAIAGELDTAVMNTRVALPPLASGKICLKGPVNFIDIASVKAVGKRSVSSVQDLKGKKVGTLRGTVGHISLHLWLDMNGVPRESVEVVNVSPPDMPVTLARGDVDAIIWTEPTPSLAIKVAGSDKVHEIGDMSAAYRDVVPLNVTCAWHQKYGDEGMKRLTAAWIDAVAYLKANPEPAAAITAGRLQLQQNEVLSAWREGKWLELGWPANLSDEQIDMYERNAKYLLSIGELKEMPDLKTWVSSKWLKQVAPERVQLNRHSDY